MTTEAHEALRHYRERIYRLESECLAQRESLERLRVVLATTREEVSRARHTFCEIHGGEYGLDFARLYPATRPDKGVVEVLRAQEGVTGLGLYSASKREEA